MSGVGFTKSEMHVILGVSPKSYVESVGNMNRYPTVLLLLLIVTGLFPVAGCRLRPLASSVTEEASSTSATTSEKNSGSVEKLSPSVSRFPTFTDTGENLCTNAEGRPVILLFTRTSCSHCQWIGDVFDFIAKEYVEKGLVEAHHYDLDSKDDLLTEALETEVPHSYLDLGKRRDPEGILPYFNFGCRYERFGNGYEESDDLAAEAREMTSAIEALLGK